jgi:hypothetical protein
MGTSLSRRFQWTVRCENCSLDLSINYLPDKPGYMDCKNKDPFHTHYQPPLLEKASQEKKRSLDVPVLCTNEMTGKEFQDMIKELA